MNLSLTLISIRVTVLLIIFQSLKFAHKWLFTFELKKNDGIKLEKLLHWWSKNVSYLAISSKMSFLLAKSVIRFHQGYGLAEVIYNRLKFQTSRLLF